MVNAYPKRGRALVALALLITTVTSIALIPIQGFIVAATWNWFLVPITNLREISVWEGVGVAFFFTAITCYFRSSATQIVHRTPTNEDELFWIFFKAIYNALAEPLIGLAMAWAWHIFSTANNLR